MSDNAYLPLLDERRHRVERAWRDGDGRSWIALYAPRQVPALWLALFSEADTRAESESALCDLDLAAPGSWVPCTTAIPATCAGLRARQSRLGVLHAAEGGFAHHAALFAQCPETLGEGVVGLDLAELAANGGAPSPPGPRALLSRMDRKDPGVRDPLDRWSTVRPGVRQIAIEQGRGCSAEEGRNCFRARGIGYRGDAPWD